MVLKLLFYTKYACKIYRFIVFIYLKCVVVYKYVNLKFLYCDDQANCLNCLFHFYNEIHDIYKRCVSALA